MKRDQRFFCATRLVMGPKSPLITLHAPKAVSPFLETRKGNHNPVCVFSLFLKGVLGAEARTSCLVSRRCAAEPLSCALPLEAGHSDLTLKRGPQRKAGCGCRKEAES